MLMLNNNNIEELDRYTFHELKNLGKMTSESNKINPYLVSLTLGNNRIKFLSGDQFTMLTSIQFLSIENNLLQVPATGWFKSSSLRYSDLWFTVNRLQGLYHSCSIFIRKLFGQGFSTNMPTCTFFY